MTDAVENRIHTPAQQHLPPAGPQKYHGEIVTLESIELWSKLSDR